MIGDPFDRTYQIVVVVAERRRARKQRDVRTLRELGDRPIDPISGRPVVDRSNIDTEEMSAKMR